jgi:Ca2+-binding RTX toxin-like protein
MPVITTTLQIAAGETVEVLATGANYALGFTLAETGNPPVDGVVLNAGTVHIASSGTGGATLVTNSNGVFLAGLFDNQASGHVLVEATGTGSAFGMQAGQLGPDLSNEGDFQVTSHAFSTGLDTNASVVFSNTGVFLVHGDHGAIGAAMRGGGSFTNTGTLDVSSGDTPGYGLLVNYGGTFANSGVLRVSDGTAALDSVAVYYAHFFSAQIAFNNSGLIEGDYAFKIYPYYQDEPQTSDVLNNTGQVHGIVQLGAGDDIIENSGEMIGRIELGEGDDHYSGVNGTLSGPIWAGMGADSINGGADSGVFFGQDGADVINGGAANDFIDGGRDGDILDGGGGFDTVSWASAMTAVVVDVAAGTATGGGTDHFQAFERYVGSAFADQVGGGASADVIEGGAGDDLLSGGGGADRLSGQAGADTLTGGAGDDDFRFEAGGGHDTITDFAAGGAEDHISVYGYAAYQSLQQTGADCLVVFSAADSILLKNVSAGALTAGDFVFHAALPTDEALPAAPPSTLGDHPVIHGDFHTWAGEVFSVSGGADGFLITDPYIANPNLTNDGSIVLTTAQATGYVAGVEADSRYIPSGHFENGATGVVQVQATGGARAYGFYAGAWSPSITNAGLIDVTAVGAAGGIVSQDFGGFTPDVVINSGVIHVQSGAAAVGVWLAAAAHFSNSGTIVVQGQAASQGVQLYGISDFHNDGAITVTDGTQALDSAAMLIIAGAGGTVHNTAAVSGDYAVKSLGTDLTLWNSGALHGLVDLTSGTAQVHNSGSINGAVLLGAGADTYDAAGGTQTGGVFGGGGNDSLTGGAGDDLLLGGLGDDTLAGAGGLDTVSYADITGGGVAVDLSLATAQNTGAAGVDTLSGFENLTGSDGADTLKGDGGANVLTGGAGADVVNGGAGNDVVYGGADGDSVDGGDGNDTVYGGAGGDSIYGGAGNDVLYANDAANNPDEASDFLFDILGTNTFYGGFADVAAFESATGAVTIDLAAGTAVGPGFSDTLVNIDSARGSNFADVISGSSAANNLDGLSGDDLIYGGAGADRVMGGAGNDTLHGGGDDDILEGGLGDDTLFGDAGSDVARYYDATSAVTVSLAITTAQNTGGAGADTLIGIENLLGSSFNDVLTGDAGANRIDGSQGADAMAGGLGDDTYVVDNTGDVVTEGAGAGTDSVEIHAAGINSYTLPTNVENLSYGWVTDFTGTGNGSNNVITGAGANDTLSGLGGADTLVGSVGDDTLYGGDGDDVLDGGAGSDGMAGGLGDDAYLVDSAGDSVVESAGEGVDNVTVSTLAGYTLTANVENLTYSGSAAFTGAGNASNNILTGGAGADTLNGLAGADILVGAAGADTLNGGVGDDTLTGGAGSDVLNGGAGHDVAAYSAASTSATWTHNANGSWTVNAGVDGTDTLTGVEVLRFTDRDVLLSQPTRSDFNLDGKSDVLWRNDSGELYVWNSQSGQGAFLGQTLGNPGLGWHVQDTGDYNGDGKADILWRNNAGDLYVYKSDAGSAVSFTGQSISYVDPVWAVVPQTGDFNGDGRADILFRNTTTGEVYVWSSQAGSAAVNFLGQSLGAVPSNWSIKGVGDFNADGRADVLWRSDAGDVYVWLDSPTGAPAMSGQTISSVGADWTILGLGDFNGDGREDILWRHTDGELYVWNSQTGSAAVNFLGQSLGLVSLDWSVSAIGDYDGDGRADVLFRNADGRVYLWNSNDTGPVAFQGQGLGTTPTDWHILSDFHGM